MPIDRVKRSEFIKLLSELSTGVISTGIFEDLMPESDDLAIEGIAMHGAWFYYTDLCTEKRVFEEVGKKEVSYWILFLESDFEYAWPEVTVGQRLLFWVTIGRFGSSLKNCWESHGDIDFWPFVNKRDYEKVKVTKDFL